MNLLKNRTHFEIEELIKGSQSLDLQGISDTDLEDRLSKLAIGYSCITRKVKISPSYRARLLEAGAELYPHVDQLWYPPADKVKNWGRLNRPSQSVMYLAGSHGTALLEMRPKVGSRYVIMELRQKNSFEMAHLMEIGLAERVSEFGLPITVPILENTCIGRKFLGKEARKNLALRSFLAREFIKIIPEATSPHLE